jgi:diacylglycerol kinase family enzyme
MKLLFVINPISGDIDKVPFTQRASLKCEKYGIECFFFKTEGENDEERLKEKVSDFNPDKVAVIGGDGTVLLAAKILQHTNIPFGIIPLGSANGLAKELFVEINPDQALQDIIMSQITKSLDMIVLNDKYDMLHIGDVGVNANLVGAYDKDPNQGMATYAKYFIEKLREIEPFSIHIETKGKTYEEKGLMVGICNSRKYGTGIPLNLNGDMTDGKFEIVVIININLGSLIKAGLSRFDENFYDNQDRKVISTSEAKITFNVPRLLQLDGETVGEFDVLNIAIKKSAVNIITLKTDFINS